MATDNGMTCLQCGEAKPIAEMARVNGKPIKHCKSCKNAYGREWRRSNPERTAEYTRRKNEDPGFKERKSAYMRDRYDPEKNRDRLLRRNYGISSADYDEIASRQAGLCAICGNPPKVGTLAVDHCHASGVVRGLLCATCNLAIGYLKDNPDYMVSAAAYVLSNRDVLAGMN